MQNNIQKKSITEYQNILDRVIKGEHITEEEKESIKLLSEEALAEITNILNKEE